MEKQADDFRSGLVPIVGRPNVGKSTLINRLLGEKIAIISARPQTTWNRILGVKTLNHAQIMFVDTPGIHEANSKLNRYMLKTAKGTLKDADIILHMIEAPDLFPRGEEVVWEVLKCIRAPVILLINKIDLVEGVDDLMQPSLPFPYIEVMRISALLGTGVDLLEKEIISLLPCGPRYYPDEFITDQTERFMVGEIIREKIFNLTHQEIPYSCAVVVEDFKEKGKGVTRIMASINVERESQKGIIIGRGARMLREIGRQARIDIENFLGAKVYLELWVRVQKDWTKKDYTLREFGLS